MSEHFDEPAAEPTLADAGAEPAEPAGDTPAKVYICPACGKRYDAATDCANGHSPTAAVEYDRATVEAADAGDADAITKVGEIAAAAAGNTAGVTPGEATPAPVEPEAVAMQEGPAVATPTATAPGAVAPATATTATPDGIGGTEASAVTPDGVHPNIAAVGGALADLEAAIRAARTALGLGG